MAFGRPACSAARRLPVTFGVSIAMLAVLAGCQSSGGTPAASGPTVDPASFVGRSEAEVTGALGAPDNARAELDAQILQYAGPDCVVDFFLYPEGGVQVVAHAEARNRTTGAAVSRCAMRAG